MGQQQKVETRAVPGSRGRLTAVGLQLFVRPVLAWWPLTPTALQTASVLDRVAGWMPQSADTRIEPAGLEGVRGEWVHPVQDLQLDRVVLYIHGGGFVVGSPRTHRRLVARIAHAARMSALSIEYRLFPKTDFSGAVGDCLKAYRALLDSGFDASRIVIGGDSAGGMLAFAVTLRAIDEGLPKPAGIFGLSPWLDFDSSNRTGHRNANRDAYLPASRFAEVSRKLLGGLSPESASPVNGSVQQLPPVLIQVSEGEMLLHDAEVMAERLAQAGVPCSLQVWAGRIHVFQVLADIIPEGRHAIEEIGQFIDDVMNRPETVTGWRGRMRSKMRAAWERLRRRVRETSLRGVSA